MQAGANELEVEVRSTQSSRAVAPPTRTGSPGLLFNSTLIWDGLNWVKRSPLLPPRVGSRGFTATPMKESGILGPVILVAR